MEYFFSVLKSILDGVGMAIFLLVAVFVFAISVSIQFIKSQMAFKAQQNRLDDLYGRAPKTPISPEQEKDAVGEGVAVGMGEKEPVDYFNDLSKK